MNDYEHEPEVGAIQQLIDEEAALQQQITHKREQIQACAIDLLTRLAGKQQQVATYLYWQIPEVTSKTIATAVGIRPHSIQHYVTPIALEKCADCGTDITYSSRTSAAELSRQQRHSTRYGNPSIPSLCDECRLARNKLDRGIPQQREQAQAKEYEDRQLRYKELATMPYEQYLQTPEWRGIRQDALKSANYRCQVCYATKPLHVHHRTYERRGHEHHSDLIVLCEDCHKMYHFAER